MFKQGKGPVRLQINSWDDLEEFFYSHIRGIEMFNSERSCPIGSIGNELSSENELIRQDVNLIFEYVRNNISNFFADLKVKGKLKKSADPESLADFCICAVQGALLLAKVRKNSKAAENTVNHALKYLKSFSK
jgi:TetR/AcrR family transcriptional repressor of nem operon